MYTGAMAQATPTPNRFEQRRQRNRAALLDAAIALFQKRGLRGTRLEDICARADVSPRTFFNHFETREHLYRAIARQRAEQMAERIETQADDPRPLGERLPRLFAEIGAYLDARPAYRELVGEMLSLRPEGGSEAARNGVLGRAVLRFIERGVARGEIAEARAPEALADLMLGALLVGLTNWCADDAFDLEKGLGQSARALLDLF